MILQDLLWIWQDGLVHLWRHWPCHSPRTPCRYDLLQCHCAQAAELPLWKSTMNACLPCIAALPLPFGSLDSSWSSGFQVLPFFRVLPGIRDLLDPKKDNLKIHEDKVHLGISSLNQSKRRRHSMAGPRCLHWRGHWDVCGAWYLVT